MEKFIVRFCNSTKSGYFSLEYSVKEYPEGVKRFENEEKILDQDRHFVPGSHMFVWFYRI